jgi:hypothetical protein
MTYRVTTPPELEATKDTYEAHQLYGAVEQITDTFNSVSVTTYQIIPSLLGVTVDPDKGVIAGTVYDCNDDPVEAASVIVVDAGDGSIPQTEVVKYFVNEFPNRNQPYTSEDGLFVATNIPEGTFRIEAWVLDGSEHKLVGSTVLQTRADSINISNIYTGFDNGVKYPASCLVE